jgi:uncharacterized repeat protein (TIGR04138 family)
VELKIWDVIRDDPRYAYEAHEFLCDAVSYTQEMLDRLPQEGDDPETDYHISAQELSHGVCELAVLEFGMMAPIVFRQWGIRTTADIGEIVFHLIRAEKLSQSERDHLEDFQDLFDIEEALTTSFEFAMPHALPGGR